VYSALGTVTYNEVMLGVHKDPRKALEKAVELGKKAVALGDSSSLAHSQLVYPYIILREHDKAIAEAERAVALEPNSAVAYNALAWAIHCDGRSQEAIPFFKKSIRLSPIPLPGALVNMGHAYRQTGQYEEAVAAYKRAIQIYGADHLPGHLGLAGAYALMGREKEARAEAAEVLRIDPKFSLERIARLMPFKSQAMIDNVIEPLRKAGLK
jgi:adenylate cyclase